jgi:DNA ligase (NAD+)
LFKDVHEAKLLSGQQIVFTGRFVAFTRNEGKAQAIRLGAQIASVVSKSTTLVVVGNDAGNNKNKAVQLGIKVASEEDWLNMLDTKSLIPEGASSKIAV